MGDSFHFGEGLNDGQTLSAHLARQSVGALRPANLAVPGYGPNQVLRQLQLGRLPPSGANRFDYLLLSVLDEHFLRASGMVQWMLDSPRYDLVDGRLVRAGTFRPSSRFVDRLLANSMVAALAKQALDQHDSSIGPRFAAILREIRREAKARHGAEVLILYHAQLDMAGNRSGDRHGMRSLICQAGVPYIDVVARVGVTRETYPRYYIPDDGHPTSEMNARVAQMTIDYVDGKVEPERCRD